MRFVTCHKVHKFPPGSECRLRKNQKIKFHNFFTGYKIVSKQSIISKKLPSHKSTHFIHFGFEKGVLFVKELVLKETIFLSLETDWLITYTMYLKAFVRECPTFLVHNASFLFLMASILQSHCDTHRRKHLQINFFFPCKFLVISFLISAILKQSDVTITDFVLLMATSHLLFIFRRNLFFHSERCQLAFTWDYPSFSVNLKYRKISQKIFNGPS